MPDYPTPRPASHNYTRNVTIGFVDYKGNTKNLKISGIDATVTQGEVDALRASAGAISNAGVYSDALEDDTVMDIVDALTYIDPHAEVSDVGVFVFGHPNNNFRDIYVEVPALWSDKVNIGSKVIDREDAEVASFIADATAILNKVQVGGGNFYLKKAYMSDRKGVSAIQENRPNTRDPRNPPV